MAETWLYNEIFQNMPFLASFLAGILTFLSPCILPLLPAYLSYISGLSLQELKHNNTSHLPKIILNCSLFLLGFFLGFIFLGLFISSFLGKALNHPITRYIAGGIIIILGLHFMGVLKIKALYVTKRLDLQSKYSLLSPFVLGLSFSLGWSPCSGPILSSIYILATTDQNYSFALLVTFFLGLGIPFLISSIFVNRSLKFLKNLGKYMRLIEICSGILLILIGIAIAFDGIGIATTWIQGGK